jgi:hypothetical protein
MDRREQEAWRKLEIARKEEDKAWEVLREKQDRFSDALEVWSEINAKKDDVSMLSLVPASGRISH